jgi:hypothetical protein
LEGLRFNGEDREGRPTAAEKAALIAWIAFVFVLAILSRIADRRRRRRVAPAVTSSSTRTTGSHAIKAAVRSVLGI